MFTDFKNYNHGVDKQARHWGRANLKVRVSIVWQSTRGRFGGRAPVEGGAEVRACAGWSAGGDFPPLKIH
jgi:hypothetical protein